MFVPEKPQPPKTACVNAKKILTWTTKSPRGYWTKNNQWQSLICREPPLNKLWVQNCLTDTTVTFIGDSNAGIMNRTLGDILNCSSSSNNVCKSPGNTIIKFYSHEFPFYSTGNKKVVKRHGTATILDRIPSNDNKQKHIVIFHYYLHPVRSHPIFIYMCLQNLRRNVRALLQRVPDVKVFIRGPHITTVDVPRRHMLGGDVLAQFHLRFYDMFVDLRHTVVFLDGWDMSLAMENESYHVTDKFNLAIIRTMLAFMCR